MESAPGPAVVDLTNDDEVVELNPQFPVPDEAFTNMVREHMKKTKGDKFEEKYNAFLAIIQKIRGRKFRTAPELAKAIVQALGTPTLLLPYNKFLVPAGYELEIKDKQVNLKTVAAPPVEIPPTAAFVQPKLEPSPPPQIFKQPQQPIQTPSPQATFTPASPFPPLPTSTPPKPALQFPPTPSTPVPALSPSVTTPTPFQPTTPTATGGSQLSTPTSSTRSPLVVSPQPSPTSTPTSAQPPVVPDMKTKCLWELREFFKQQKNLPDIVGIFKKIKEAKTKQEARELVSKMVDILRPAPQYLPKLKVVCPDHSDLIEQAVVEERVKAHAAIEASGHVLSEEDKLIMDSFVTFAASGQRKPKTEDVAPQESVSRMNPHRQSPATQQPPSTKKPSQSSSSGGGSRMNSSRMRVRDQKPLSSPPQLGTSIRSSSADRGAKRLSGSGGEAPLVDLTLSTKEEKMEVSGGESSSHSPLPEAPQSLEWENGENIFMAPPLSKRPPTISAAPAITEFYNSEEDDWGFKERMEKLEEKHRKKKKPKIEQSEKMEVEEDPDCPTVEWEIKYGEKKEIFEFPKADGGPPEAVLKTVFAVFGLHADQLRGKSVFLFDQDSPDILLPFDSRVPGKRFELVVKDVGS